MSVILFAKEDVYQEMADAFEELKHVLRVGGWGEERFYKAMRRLYFGNVATYLCQYHDNTPLSSEELSVIDPFMDLQGRRDDSRLVAESAHNFLQAWSSLKYNLITNDGERYEVKESIDFMNELALKFAREALQRQVEAMT